MELGDLVYILVGVVALLFSFIKKSKNRGRLEESLPQYEQESNFDLEEVLQTVFNTPESTKTNKIEIPKLEKKPVYESKYKRMSYENRHQNRKIITSSLKKRKEPTIFLEEKEKEEEKKIYWSEENFDLHKAVIYSEILKQPNFNNNNLIR